MTMALNLHEHCSQSDDGKYINKYKGHAYVRLRMLGESGNEYASNGENDLDSTPAH